MKKLHENPSQDIPGVTPLFLWIYKQIAGWEKALIANILWKGWEMEVEWPALTRSSNTIRMFDKVELLPGQKIQVYNPESDEVQNIDSPWLHFIHPDAIVIEYQKIILNEWEIAWLYDENWEYEEVTWPKVIYEHPEGNLERFRRIQLSEREAVVKVQRDGKEEIVLWKDMPEIFINPVVEKLKNFRWTWSWEWGPDSEKVPDMINFEILRLDNSQTYFSFPVRTKDNVVVNLKLMIFYDVSSVENLVRNTHDPMCEFYNKLQATLTWEIAKQNFDDFKNNTWKFISDMTDNESLDFENIWLSIDEIVLREWEPQERRVQDILEKAAMVESQKWLDEADHKRKLQLLDYEKEQASKQTEVADERTKNAQQEGEQEGEKLVKMYKCLEESVWAEWALALMKLHLAGSATELNIWSNMLK